MHSGNTNRTNIVVIHTAFLGDLLLSIAFFKKIRNLFPEASVHLVCRKNTGDFFKELNLIDQFYEIEKGNQKTYNNMANTINAMGVIDILFLPHKSLRSLFLALKIKSKKRISYSGFFHNLVISKTVKRNLKWPETIRMLQLLTLEDENFKNEINKINWEEYNQKIVNHLKPIGNSYTNIVSNLDRLILFFELKKNHSMIMDNQFIGVQKLSEKKENLFRRLDFLDTSEKQMRWEQNKKIFIFPGSVWATKRWPIEYYSELADMFINNNYNVVLMGGPGEESIVMSVKLKMKSRMVYDFTAKTNVLESALLLSEADLVVGNDSASAHLAMTMDKKMLSFFGPTVLNFGYRPWGNQVYVLENLEIKCRPCGAHGPQKCPIGTHECMKSIPVIQAFNLAQTIVSLDKRQEIEI